MSPFSNCSCFNPVISTHNAHTLQWLAAVGGCIGFVHFPAALPHSGILNWGHRVLAARCRSRFACMLRPFPKQHWWIEPLSAWQCAEPGLIPDKEKQRNTVIINCTDWKYEVWGEAIACTKRNDNLLQDCSDWLVCRSAAPTSIPQSTCSDGLSAPCQLSFQLLILVNEQNNKPLVACKACTNPIVFSFNHRRAESKGFFSP